MKCKPIIIGQFDDKNKLYEYQVTQIGYIPRCINCAKFHQFIVDVSRLIIVFFFLIIVTLLSNSSIKIILRDILMEIKWRFNDFNFLIFYLVLIELAAYGILLFSFLKSPIISLKGILGILTAPSKQKSLYKIKKAKEYKKLSKEGYHINQFDSSKNALEKLKIIKATKKKKKWF
jgi:hypothetical protein